MNLKEATHILRLARYQREEAIVLQQDNHVLGCGYVVFEQALFEGIKVALKRVSVGASVSLRMKRLAMVASAFTSRRMRTSCAVRTRVVTLLI